MTPEVVLLLIFVGVFLVFLFLGWLIAFSLAGAVLLAYIFAKGSVLNFAVLSYNAAFNYNLLALPIFILMGEILIQGGVAAKLYDSVVPLFERFPGGLIHTNIAANVVLGACCGSTIAATSAMSDVAIPELMKRGYAKGICYGSLASAGCLAALIPPSVGMIVFASITTVSLAELFVGGIFPGLLLAATLAIVTIAWVKIRPEIVPPAPKELMPLKKALLSMLKLWSLAILILLVLGTIYLGIGTPTEAGCYGVVGALLLGCRKLSRERLKTALLTSCRISCSLLFIIAIASVFGFALNALGLQVTVLSVLSGLPGGMYIKMFCVYLMLMGIGMFLDSASVTIISTPILLPYAVSLGFEPVWFGVWLVLAVELGNVTPPVGVTLYAVQAVSGDKLTTIARGCFPYWASFFGTMFLMTFFPGIALWLPSKGF